MLLCFLAFALLTNAQEENMLLGCQECPIPQNISLENEIVVQSPNYPNNMTNCEISECGKIKFKVQAPENHVIHYQIEHIRMVLVNKSVLDVVETKVRATNMSIMPYPLRDILAFKIKFIAVPFNYCTNVHIDHGILMPESFVYMSNVERTNGLRLNITCNLGYQLLGTNELSCGADGKWMPDTFPTCERDPNYKGMVYLGDYRPSTAKEHFLESSGPVDCAVRCETEFIALLGTTCYCSPNFTQPSELNHAPISCNETGHRCGGWNGESLRSVYGTDRSNGSCNCGQSVFKGVEGVVKLMGYCNNMFCIYNITVPPNMEIEIKFSGKTHSDKDFLTLDRWPTSTLSGNLTDLKYRIPFNNVVMTFTSDELGVDEGFQAEFQAVVMEEHNGEDDQTEDEDDETEDEDEDGETEDEDNQTEDGDEGGETEDEDNQTEDGDDQTEDGDENGETVGEDEDEDNQTEDGDDQTEDGDEDGETEDVDGEQDNQTEGGDEDGQTEDEDEDEDNQTTHGDDRSSTSTESEGEMSFPSLLQILLNFACETETGKEILEKLQNATKEHAHIFESICKKDENTIIKESTTQQSFTTYHNRTTTLQELEQNSSGSIVSSSTEFVTEPIIYENIPPDESAENSSIQTTTSNSADDDDETSTNGEEITSTLTDTVEETSSSSTAKSITYFKVYFPRAADSHFCIATVTKSSSYATEKVCECERSAYDGKSGVIKSPNYPENYCNNLDCKYNITVPSGFTIHLKLDMDTEECCDIIRDVKSHKCYSGKWKGNITTNSNNLLLKFITNGLNTQTGFKGEYTAVDNIGCKINVISFTLFLWLFTT